MVYVGERVCQYDVLIRAMRRCVSRGWGGWGGDRVLSVCQ